MIELRSSFLRCCSYNHLVGLAERCRAACAVRMAAIRAAKPLSLCICLLPSRCTLESFGSHNPWKVGKHARIGDNDLLLRRLGVEPLLSPSPLLVLSSLLCLSVLLLSDGMRVSHRIHRVLGNKTLLDTNRSHNTSGILEDESNASHSRSSWSFRTNIPGGPSLPGLVSTLPVV